MLIRTLALGCLLVALVGCDDATERDERRAFELCIAPETPARSALKVCSRAIESGRLGDHDLAHAHYVRAHAHMRGGNAESALSDLERAVEIEPDDVFWLVARAGYHGSNGRLERALEDLRQADQMKPNHPLVLGNLAIAMETIDPEQALVFADRAIKLDPDARALGQRCWMRAIMKRDLESAVADCDRALALEYEPGNTLNSRGLVYFRLGQFEKSIADYNRSETLLPGMASTYYVRGLAKRRLGDAAGAEADIARGIEVEPGIVQRFSGYGVE
jgi:tetratricopeptide (TPR) repeat protein